MAVTTRAEQPREAASATPTKLGLRTLVDLATRSHAHACAYLVAICLLAFLPGFFQIPPVDRDEARFAQATKQMLETGDYVDIRFQDETRYKKPVGIYWLQALAVKSAEAAGMRGARQKIWLYRIPSLIGATGGVVLTYWAALAFLSRRAAMLAALMMADSILLGVEARLAKTDAMLLLTVVAAMGSLARIYMQARGDPFKRGHMVLQPAIFWSALAAGILLKGPLILMIAVLAMAALSIADRSGRWLLQTRPWAGIAWMLLLVLPWFVAIVLKSGESFFAESIGHDLFAKLGSVQETHGGPPGLYLILFWGTFFPGAMLAPLATRAVWRARSEPGTRFLLAWLVPSWIVFEAAVTKLPHYVLPLYPAIAILIAGAVEGRALSRQRWLERGTASWFVLTVIVACGLIGMNIVLRQQLGLLAGALAAAAVISALFAWWLYDIDGPVRSLMRALAASVLIGWAAFGATFPAIHSLFPAQSLSELVHGVRCKDPLVATAGYHEPSLVFLIGTGLQHTDGAGAAEFLQAGGCRIALVDSRLERSFAQRADAIGLRYTLGARVEGINISAGRAISIAIYLAGGGL